jgi:hypothetical protein
MRAAARMRSRPVAGSMSRETPRLPSTNENSPTWAIAAASVTAAPTPRPHIRTTTKQTRALPRTTMRLVAMTGIGSVTRIAGLNSIPTETKNRTAKASRSGRVSSAASWARSDSDRTTPAKKAPMAKDTPNSSEAPKAVPRAMARTARRNSSREPVEATRSRIQGIRRRPTTHMRAPKATSLAPVRASSAHRPGSTPRRPRTGEGARSGSCPPRGPASAGSATRARTMTRSSTTSQPTAIRPRSVSCRSRSCRVRRTTTVEATERARPKTMPPPSGQPMRWPAATPSSETSATWAKAPGTATPLTWSSSLGEKCSPTPNIRRMTPISASCCAPEASATNPGVKGPIAMPATM